MAHENPEQLSTEMSPEDGIAPSPADGRASSSAEPSLSRNTSSHRLNAQAPEFVPRTPPANHSPGRMEPRVVQIHHAPPPPPVMHIFHPPPPRPAAFHHVPAVQGHAQFEYYGGGEGAYGEHEMVHAPVDPDPATAPASATSDGLSDDVVQKITKQVEYYFSDANLATTEHLMRFISKDPEGFVPISVIAAFKKIKALISNNVLLATALRTSSKLVVSDDGKKVRRQQPFTEADLEELQLHAFVEYETVEEAEKAVAELNDERNWRSGLRVRLLPTCMTKHGRGRKGGHEAERIGDDEDVSTSNQHHEKHFEDSSQSIEAPHEHMGDDDHHDKEGTRQGRGRGRGSRGRSRGPYNHNHHRTVHAAAAPSNHATVLEQPAVTKQPPGPRMPDGTRGFTMGRGKQLVATSTVALE